MTAYAGKMNLRGAFRRYHGQLAIGLCIPLILTTITGVAYSILDKWFSLKKAAALVLQIHSGSIFGLEAIYPLLNGLGLVGLLLTGLSMTSLFRKRSQKEA